MHSVLERSPVPHSWNPENVHQNEIDVIVVPFQFEWVNIPQPESERNEALVEDIWVLEINSHMLEWVARVEENLTFSVEFYSICWLVDSGGLLNYGKVGKFFDLMLQFFIEHILDVVNSTSSN